MESVNYERHNRRATIFALFLYATIIVDIFRKINSSVFDLPVSITLIRNIVYIGIFLLFFFVIKGTKEWTELAIITALFVGLTLISYLINPYVGTGSLYVDLIMMFFSRLLPAYYIGRYLGEEQDQLFAKIAQFQWIALIYSLLILIYPELSATSYITISNNLIIVTLLCLFRPAKGRGRYLSYAISALSLATIVIYGGRGSLLSVLFVFALRLMVGQGKNRTQKMIFGIMATVFIAFIFFLFYQEIADFLLRLRPDSRTFKLMARGRFFWDANRNRYYTAAQYSIKTKPFKIYGFLGDRFYFAEFFGSTAGYDRISAMFAHNVIYEVLLNFGVPLGLVILIPTTIKSIIALKNVMASSDRYQYTMFIVVFGSVVISLLISYSYLNEYSIWLLFGLIMNYSSRNGRYESSYISKGRMVSVYG